MILAKASRWRKREIGSTYLDGAPTIMRLKAIAEETVAALEHGSYTTTGDTLVDISSLLKRCIEGTRCYDPDELGTIDDQIVAAPRLFDHTELHLLDDTTLP